MDKLPISSIKEVLEIIDSVDSTLENSTLKTSAPVVLRVWTGVKSTHFSLIQDLKNIYDSYKNIPDAELDISEQLRNKIDAFTKDVHQYIELMSNIE